MEKLSSPHDDTSHEKQLLENLARQLDATLNDLVAANLLKEQDKHILALRMGLEDGTCYTLTETANMLHKSPELIRSRQYLALKRHTNNPKFFKLLSQYALLIKLPRGLTYYLSRYSDLEDFL